MRGVVLWALWLGLAVGVPAASFAGSEPGPYRPVADGGGLTRLIATLGQGGPPPEAKPAEPVPSEVASYFEQKNRYAIEVSLAKRRLYLYEHERAGERRLLQSYVVAVPGKDMESPHGWGVVTGIQFDPWWFPTAAIKERALKKGKQLPDFVKPGVKENPMGAFKILLSHGFGFRIHGNNDPRSIGRPVTSGCIRMKNDEGTDLAKKIDVGTEVVFLD